MRIPNVIKTISIGCMISALPICTNRAFAQTEEIDDFIEAEYDVVLGDREKELRELEEK